MILESADILAFCTAGLAVAAATLALRRSSRWMTAMRTPIQLEITIITFIARKQASVKMSVVSVFNHDFLTHFTRDA